MSHLNAKFHGERLREMREKNQLHQRSLADYLSVSQSTYSKYEQEKILLPINSLPVIAAYLNVDPNYLIGVIDSPLPYPKNTF